MTIIYFLTYYYFLFNDYFHLLFLYVYARVPTLYILKG